MANQDSVVSGDGRPVRPVRRSRRRCLWGGPSRGGARKARRAFDIPPKLGCGSRFSTAQISFAILWRRLRPSLRPKAPIGSTNRPAPGCSRCFSALRRCDQRLPASAIFARNLQAVEPEPRPRPKRSLPVSLASPDVPRPSAMSLMRGRHFARSHRVGVYSALARIGG